MQLIIHRGTNTIGANCVEIRTDSTRIFLDVGMPLFDDDRNPFDDSRIRGKNTDQLVQEGILPKIPGLFTEGSPPDAILLSHAHMDHTGFLSYTRPEIPVYATTGTSKMMKAGAIFARQQEIPRDRFRKLTAGASQQIGDFRITTFAVDHSVYGSAAFLIEGDGKTLLYSGDLRLHGRKTGMAKTMLAALENKRIDVLLAEGTQIASDNPKNLSEYDLEKEIAKHVASAPGLVLASFSPQHVDRLVAFIKAAQRTNRIFVADVYSAYVLYSIKSETKVPPPVTGEGIQVFYPKHFLSNYQRRRLQKIHDLFIEDQITLEEILSEPEKYLMVFRPSMLDMDFDAAVPEKSLCIFSRWEGYLDQSVWQTTQGKIKDADGTLLTLHTSGHIAPADLVAFVNQIAPKTIVPIHTFEPEKFNHHFTNVHPLKDGETFDV